MSSQKFPPGRADLHVFGDSIEKNESLTETIRKTAQYVVENGSSLEELLRQDTRFSFVIPGDVNFHLYQEILEREHASRATEDKRSELDSRSTNPEEPYLFSFSNYDENITQRDLEIIKLAAAFCVANESNNYLEKMRQEFGDDELFGFLNPDHAMNGTFIQFINQYKQVKSNSLGPPFLEWKNKDYKAQILLRSFQRAEFNVYVEESRAEKDKTLNLKKIQFAAFDWSRFKVVGKVTPPASDSIELPDPLDFNQLALKRLEKADKVSLFDTDEGDSASKGTKSKKRKLKAAGSTRLKMTKTGTDRAVKANVKSIRCPITNEMIPEEKFDRHLQVLLADPHYKVERERFEAKHRLSNLSSNDVYENIKKLARGSDPQI